MKGFLGVQSVRVARSLAIEANDHLRKVGLRGLEGFALWVGTRNGDTFTVEKTLIPDQEGIRSRMGVSVSVGPEELHRINVWLFRNKMSLIAQIHSHPTNAYHSATDDDFAVATVVGSLSIVVPDFASAPFSIDQCAVYRLSAEGFWTVMSVHEINKMITIIG